VVAARVGTRPVGAQRSGWVASRRPDTLAAQLLHHQAPPKRLPVCSPSVPHSIPCACLLVWCLVCACSQPRSGQSFVWDFLFGCVSVADFRSVCLACSHVQKAKRTGEARKEAERHSQCVSSKVQLWASIAQQLQSRSARPVLLRTVCLEI